MVKASVSYWLSSNCWSRDPFRPVPILLAGLNGLTPKTILLGPDLILSVTRMIFFNFSLSQAISSNTHVVSRPGWVNVWSDFVMTWSDFWCCQAIFVASNIRHRKQLYWCRWSPSACGDMISLALKQYQPSQQWHFYSKISIPLITFNPLRPATIFVSRLNELMSDPIMSRPDPFSPAGPNE